MLDEDDGAAGDDLESPFPEPDPEADLPDPESELPTVPSPPSVDVPTAPTPDGDVPEELLAGFWTTVLVFNVALLATSVGAMMVAFDVHRTLGAGVLAVGLLSSVRGYRKYRALDERHRSGELTDGAGDAEEPTADSEDTGAPTAGAGDADEERNG